MELPITQQLIERSIFHNIRKTIVAAGYIPDVGNYDVTNTIVATAAAESQRYLNDAAIIKAAKGFIIDIFSNGTSQDRGQMKVPRIVVETEAFLPGQLGIDTTNTYNPNINGGFDKMDNAFLTKTSDFYFNIKLLSNTTAQQRILYSIILMTIPRRGYMKWHEEPGLLLSQNMFVNFLAHYEQEHTQEGITEKTYRYEISDVIEIPANKIVEVPAIINIGDNLDIQVI